jgi:microcystin-dependent protein
MTQQYLGEIRMFAGNFAPVGWLLCAGQILDISTNDALFSLIGTTYGGDGQVTFALPDLRGRVPVHEGLNAGVAFEIGQNGGVESVALTTPQMPTHSHQLSASKDPATTGSPQGNVLAAITGAGVLGYGTDQPVGGVSPKAIAISGGGQPHDNFQPYLCINFIIATAGIYPPRN